jgi:integrase
MKLTVKSTGALKLAPGQSDFIAFDNDIPGFGLRLRDGGSRTWIFQYKLGSKQRRMVIGSAKAITAEKARELAGVLHAKVRLGRDPAAAKAASIARAANDLGELVRRYLEHQKGELRPRSYVEVERHLARNAKALHGMPVSSIDRRTIADRLNLIAKESGAVTANRTRACLSAAFSWAMREGLAEANPVAGTGKREERARDRVLSDQEIKTIWDALEDDRFGAIVKLLTLTGQRKNEIAGLRWSEIDFDAGLISLPAERTKNARPHQIPMSAAVAAILRAQPRAGEFVFGGVGGAFSGWSRSKDILDGRLPAMAPWVIHDLRRTCATRMADIGIAPHVVEAVLNHVSGHKGGIAGVYNRALYVAEKAQALDRWADHVAAILDGRKSNVTELRRPA